MNKIITIGREFGSGGREIGMRLAKKLNIPVYGKELINLVCENSDFSKNFVERNEEKAPSFFVPPVNVPTLTTFYQQSYSDRIYIEQSKIINELAEKGPAVFIGRCANYVLAEKKPIKIFIYASLERRIKRKECQLVKNEKREMSEKELERFIKDVDKKRAAYYRFYTDGNWDDLREYHLGICTDNITLDGAVDVICAYIENYKK